MNEALAQLIAEAHAILARIEDSFGLLTPAQLNWKPDEKSWSIGQCLEHLIITNELEFPAIKDAFGKNYRNPFWSKIPFLSNIFGRTAIYIFSPKNPRKIKAPRDFRPSSSEIGRNIVGDFAAHQREVIELFEESEKLDVEKTKIVSPVGSFITYSLIDAFRVLIVHEERHFRQAERVLKNADFPQ